ncbi:GNAT family N-acetyltransferase [Chitinimonas sp.]|uniref:GNAT family N-acetyltransferase n=1 Tax=Chitinimonas sp. TaxID=1934313 RepID=UPI0035B08113
MSLVVRRFIEADAVAMGQLLSVMGYPAADGATMLRRLCQLESGAPFAIFVAEQDGVVIGWVHVGRVFQSASEGYAEVFLLAVDEAHQGLGIGRQLLEHAEQWVRESFGTLRIRLGSGVHRSEAHGFYQHLGYEKRPSFVFQKQLQAIG